MHGNLEPEEKVLEDKEDKNEDQEKIPVLDGYACPYPRRKISLLNDY